MENSLGGENFMIYIVQGGAVRHVECPKQGISLLFDFFSLKRKKRSAEKDHQKPLDLSELGSFYPDGARKSQPARATIQVTLENMRAWLLFKSRDL